ncbi:AraC family transcriptional regulator [Actinacidiphila sp. bgisy160]|uniref:AraC family transcriptional regulator n=1 Tax=Actinacidiphila sp. bgisy160 TaxID=3413796 RepID=UPI003D71C970
MSREAAVAQDLRQGRSTGGHRESRTRRPDRPHAATGHGLVRGSALSGFRELVTELGGAPDDLLHSAGIEPAMAGRYEEYLPFRRVMELLEAAAESTGTPDLGRRLGRRQSADILGPVVPAARTARTLAEAVEVFSRYLGTFSTACSLWLVPRPAEGLAFVEFRSALGRRWLYPQGAEAVLSRALTVLRLLAGSPFLPVDVHVPHRPLTSQADYESDYCTTVLFDQLRPGFTISAADLDRPLAHDPVAHRVLVEHLSETTPRHSACLVRPVTELAEQMLPMGVPTVEDIAARLGLHSRALQRRLSAEGLSVTDLVDVVRRDTAERLLAETDMALGRIARRLGYAEQSALSRACRRWFGMTPSGVRRTARQSGTSEAAAAHA